MKKYRIIFDKSTNLYVPQLRRWWGWSNLYWYNMEWQEFVNMYGERFTLKKRVEYRHEFKSKSDARDFIYNQTAQDAERATQVIMISDKVPHIGT